MGIAFSHVAASGLRPPPKESTRPLGIPLSARSTPKGSMPPPAKGSKPWGWWCLPRSKGAPPPLAAPTPMPSSNALLPPPTALTPTPSSKAPPPASRPWQIPRYKTHGVPAPPAPAPSFRPEPQLAFLENLMLVSAAAIPVAMAFIPFIVYVKTGSVETTVNIFRTPTLYAGALNCIIWLFYSQIIRTVDLHADELVISNCVNHAFDYSFLMIAYGFRRSVWKGIMLTMIVMSAMIYLFVALRFPIVLHESWGPYLATLGFATVASCHASQIMDITTSRGELGESLITAFNILPSLVFNGCVCYWCWRISQEEHFVLWFQSFMNSLLCMLEMALLIMRGCHRTPAVEAMENFNDDDDSRSRVPLIPLHGNGGNNNSSAISGSNSASGEAFGSAFASTCPTPVVPPRVQIVGILPESTSKEVAVTSAPQTETEGVTLPTSANEILVTVPLSASAGSNSALSEASGSAFASTCSMQVVPPRVQIVRTQPESASKEVLAVTSAPQTVEETEDVTLPTSTDEILETVPLLARPTGLIQAGSSADTTQITHESSKSGGHGKSGGDRRDGGKISKTSKPYQMRWEGQGTERARQPGANSAPVVSLTRCLPRRGKGASAALPSIV